MVLAVSTLNSIARPENSSSVPCIEIQKYRNTEIQKCKIRKILHLKCLSYGLVIMGYLLLHPPAEGQSKVAICFLSEGWTHVIAVSSMLLIKIKMVMMKMLLMLMRYLL